MGLIADLQPLNFKEEKEKFLNNPTFNPQFKYMRIFSDQDLTKHGLPNHQYIELAEKIIEKTFSLFSNKDISENRGRLLDQETVSKQLKTFLKKYGLSEKFSIIWSEEFVSRASVNPTAIKLRLPCSIYEGDLEGLIYHELGTHVLRRTNYEQQPWFRKKRKNGFSEYLKTEEGLAVLHALYPRKYPFAYLAALNFIATIKAQEESFLEVWQFLHHYLDDNERAFNMAFKKKRGLTDTSLPGGFTKDYVYFEGFVENTKFLIENDFPIKELYFGKLSSKDIDKAIEMNPNFEPLLPDFYTDNPEQYKQRVLEIARENFLI
jgi:hypothetical protein